MKRSITTAAFAITLIAIVVKMFGFVKELVLAYFYGTDFIADSYLLAISMPVIFFGWLSSVALAYVPIYTKEKPQQRISYSQKLKTALFILSAISIVIGEIIAPVLVKISSPGLAVEAHDLAVEYFRVSLLSLLFMPITEINLANLNCERHYVASNVVNLFFGSIQILFIVVSGIFDYHILIWGYTISSAIRYLASVFLCRKYGLILALNYHFDNSIKKTFLLGIPMIVSQLVAQINSMIDRILASFLASGSISILSYANTLKLFAYSIFTLAADTIIFPEVSRLTANSQYHKIYELEEKIIKIMSFVLLPITLFCCLNSQVIVYIAFYHGAFNYESLMSTSGTFIAYIIGLLPISLTEIIIRMFYSFDDSGSPLRISSISIITNAFLSAILMRTMGIRGIALATSIASLVTLPIYIYKLNIIIIKLDKKNNNEYKASIFGDVRFWIKLGISLAVMYCVHLLLPRFSIENMTVIKSIIHFFVEFIVTFVGFGVCVFLLLRKEILLILQLARRKSA